MPTEADEVLLRPATRDDAEALAALYLSSRRAAGAAMPPPVHDDDAVRAWLAGRVGDDDLEVWLAESGAAPVGFAAFTRTWLEDLYVHPDRQGEGVGSLLLDLVRSLRPEGFSLWVFAVNEPARAFYRSRGLVELEHTDGSDNEEHAPDVRLAWPGERPLEFLRRRIDEVDDDLAVLLARRAALTAAVQEHKAATGGAAGSSGRDAAREAEIADRMAAHAPGLGADRIGRVMRAVIAESLDAWESGGGPDR